MPKHPSKNSKQPEKVESKHGYYLYKDGKSYWGVNILRFQEHGVEISKEQHRDTELDKVALYTELTTKKETEEATA